MKNGKVAPQAQGSADRVVLGILPKNALERTEVSLSRFKGRWFLDIRNYFQTSDSSFLPTKRGVSIAVELFSEFQPIIDSAQAEIAERQLVEEAA